MKKQIDVQSVARLFEPAYRRLACAALLGVVFAAGFIATSAFNQVRFAAAAAPAFPVSPVDHWILLQPRWVWVYVSYYPLCFLPLLIPEIRQEAPMFSRVILGFALQFFASYGIFLALPLRIVHAALPATQSGYVLRHLYTMDQGFNSFPSLHVANLTFVALLFWRQHRPAWASCVSVAALLVAVSTLFVKQHYLADVLAGALLGWVSYGMAFSSVLSFELTDAEKPVETEAVEPPIDLQSSPWSRHFEN